MRSKMNTQLRLSVSQKEQVTCVGRFLPAILSLFATTVTVLSFWKLTGLAAIYTPAVLLLAGCGICVVRGILIHLNQEKRFYSSVLILLVFLTLLFGKQIISGCTLLWNGISDTWTLKTGWVLPKLETPTQSGAVRWGLLMVSAVAGIVIAMVICALSECRTPILSVLLPSVLLAGMVAFCEDGVFLFPVMTLVSAILFLLYSGGIVGKKSLRGIFGRILPVALTGTVLLSVAALPGVRNWSEAHSEALLKKVHARKYETRYTTLPEGNLADYQTVEDTGSAALVVNMETPEPMYLRGFTGAEFDGTNWSALDRSAVAQNRDLLYWLNLNEFYPDAQFEKAALLPQVTQNRITVQNIGACSRYLYVPYNLCENSSLDAENLRGSGVEAGGERIYMFSTASADTQQVLELLRTSREEPVLRYREAESAYRDFVYENYLGIPQEMLTLLQESWDETAAAYGGVSQFTPAQAQECVLAFLDRCFPEEGEQNTIPLPLKTLAGSTYQRATVTVMTLRYYGIPARYAEGYVITEAMAAEATDGESIDVTASHAGTWAEVYQDGIGWIPMDLTPGVEKLPVGTGEGDGDGPGASKIPEEGEELEEPQEEQEQAEPDGGYTVSLPKVVLWGGLTGLMTILLLVIALLVRRHLLLKKKNSRFEQEEPKEAVAWIFTDAALLLSEMGIHRGNGSMTDLEETVRRRFGEAYGDVYKTAVQLNGRALFSSREMTEEERACVKAFRESTLQHLKSGKKWYQKLWMQWILCLY